MTSGAAVNHGSSSSSRPQVVSVNGHLFPALKPSAHACNRPTE